MTCPCDARVFPVPLVIPAGLEDLPRQIAGFPEFRDSMLALIPSKAALAGWRARGDDDFGVMLLEMWACVCDVVAFYDKVIADESYVRTAKLRPSVRKLVGLLGYVPRPAVAATVRLALLADAKRAVTIRSGTAFRSGSFAGGAPQIFELDADTTIYPYANQFAVAPPRAAALSGTLSSLLLEPDSSKLSDGDAVAIEVGAAAYARTIVKATRVTDSDGRTFVRAELDTPITLATPVALSSARILKPTRTAQLRSKVKASEGEPYQDLTGYFLSGSAFGLDSTHKEIKAGQRILVAKNGVDFRTTLVYFNVEVNYTVTLGASFTVDGTTVVTPDIKSAFSLLLCWPYVNSPGLPVWTPGDAPNLTVHFGLVSAGRITTTAATVLVPGDPIVVAPLKVGPAGPPPVSDFVLVDAEQTGVEFEGALDWTSGVLTPASGTSWSPGLALPVTAHGNVAAATRGETVASETLGSGNGSAINQAFELKKSPLTYVVSPTADNESGVASTLNVWVDGVLWSEVPTFYGAAPDDQVYVVRQKDDGTSVVTFGDGVHGARLSTGSGNVIASYRFGAGGASPPAGSITKIAKPAAGLRSVVNPIPASGGADAEAIQNIRTLGPKSALLLGRAVSIQDMAVAAAATPGVVAAAAEWRWEGKRQRPVVKVWYIGATGLEPTIEQRLRAITDPSTPIDATPAQALTPTLALDVETDSRYIAADVAAAVKALLIDAEHGILSNERVGVGTPIFRSVIFEAVLSVPGATGVRSLQWNQQVFDAYGKSPGAGKYFDFESGNLIVIGSPS
jgi:hypothetical protein